MNASVVADLANGILAIVGNPTHRVRWEHSTEPLRELDGAECPEYCQLQMLTRFCIVSRVGGERSGVMFAWWARLCPRVCMIFS